MRRSLKLAVLLFIPWWMFVGTPAAHASTKIFLKQQFSSVSGFTADYYASATSSVLALTTSVTNSAASGTNIQQTKTAGGSAIAFISPPVSAGFTSSTSASGFTANAWAKEDAATCNCTLRWLVQDQATSCTIIDLLYTVELGTTIANVTKTGTQSACTVATGDRILITPKITNVGTMAVSHSVTMDWAGKTAAADGDTWIQMPDTFTFNLEPELIQSMTAAGSALFPGVTAAGNLIVDAVLWSGGGSASVADGTNTHNAIGSPLVIGGGNSWQLFHADNVGSNTFTETVTAAGVTNILTQEYGGMAAAPYDAQNSATGASIAPDSGAAVTNFANELIFGYLGDNGGSNAPTVGTGFVQRSVMSARAVEDRVVSSTGSYDATGTMVSSTWGSLVATFKAGTQPATGCVPKLTLLHVGNC